MATQLTADDARQSLSAHAAVKGAEIHAKYGPEIGWAELGQILADRTCVRYPCELVFDATLLQEGEFAHPVALGESPEAGFKMHVHPLFMTQLADVPTLVLYQIVAVNYGEFASGDDAVAFAAAALGCSEDDYYEKLCEMIEPLSACDCH
ncbi:MAG: hypothetical protein ACHQ4G_02150 [Opitutales bacterium]